ncbi:hypothetical protein GCM10025867_35880 [Frondihabitans sucicola]|uniref:Uncharacterized protein n=1 Tax=Frondihabitans sucicola TaxID=1268041 RepID=A0ABN6Y5C5_9MICO|nr:hypothetical protein [Frondihabitans sucicola]BDZ51347.1 hypothetical protein GCM10025867_35880 [Frondihabitans sucicola]
MSVTPLFSPTPDDPQSLLASLVEGATRALPAGVADGVLDVERARSVKDRLSGGAGQITQLKLTGPKDALTLRFEGKRLVGESAYVSGGVIISRKTLPLGDWLTAFAGEIAAIAADAAGDAASAARALQVLGVQPAGSDVTVDEADVDGGLRLLPARLDGRIPPAAGEIVARIASALRDTLPRVLGGGDTEILVRRTATAYLPDTIKAYVALPADWARSHRFTDGSTAADILVAQLVTLDEAVGRMRDAAIERDASALLVNGRFLSDRFATSSLDLP